jgi:hypothetical protein
MDKEVATLFLMTNTLGTNPNQYGFRVGSNDFTFFVDMRMWLGEMLWNNYDQYIVNVSFLTPVAAGPNMFINLMCDGLNFINTTTNGQLNGSQLLGIDYYTANPNTANNIGTWVPWQGSNARVMIKPDTNLANVRIYYQAVGGNNTQATTINNMFLLTARGIEPKMKMYKNLLNDFYTKPTRNFVLDTTVLTAGATNAYGTMNAALSQFTFTQVPIRTILGTLWDKYEKFNIIATSFGLGPNGATYNNTQSRIMWIIDGFQIINSLALGVNNTISYNKYAIIPESQPETVNINSFTAVNNFANTQSTYTIRKPESNTVDLQFTMTNASANIQPNAPSAQSRSQVLFNFIVIGVE